MPMLSSVRGDLLAVDQDDHLLALTLLADPSCARDVITDLEVGRSVRARVCVLGKLNRVSSRALLSLFSFFIVFTPDTVATPIPDAESRAKDHLKESSHNSVNES